MSTKPKPIRWLEEQTPVPPSVPSLPPPKPVAQSLRQQVLHVGWTLLPTLLLLTNLLRKKPWWPAMRTNQLAPASSHKTKTTVVVSLSQN